MAFYVYPPESSGGGGGSFTAADLTTSTSGVSITGGSSAVNGSGTTVNITTADSTHNGLLSSSDWSTFNSKLGTAITSINSQTGASQTLQTAATGTDFTIQSGSDKTTFSIPTASASNRGLLSTSDWSTFNGKLSAAITSINSQTGASQTLQTASTGTDFTIQSGSDKTTFSIPTASASNRGLLSTSDWSTFNAKAPTASPTFTTAITFGNYKLHPSEFDAGNSSTALTLDWTNGSAQKVTLTGNVTLTLSNPQTGGSYVIKIATGAGSFSVTWPGTVKWTGGSTPTITTTASKVDLINLYWDGTNYFGTYAQNY